MNEIFLLPRSYRGLFAKCLLAFLGFGTFCVYVAHGRVGPVCFFLLFWGSFIVGTVIGLLQCWRWSLTVRDDEVVERGIIRERRINLRDDVQIRWLPSNSGGMVTLRSASQKIRIPFSVIDFHERRRMIRFFRLSNPDAVQDGWDGFCFRNAFPLLENRPELPCVAASGGMTRRRWDWYCVPCILAMIAVCAFCSWQFQNPQYRILPLLCIVPWLLWRFQIPQHGKQSPVIRDRVLILFLLLSLMVVILGLIVYSEWVQYLPHGGVWGIAGIVILMAAIFGEARRADRRKRIAEQPLVEFAAREWNRMEGMSSPVPY
jgi:hypothetical protein